MAGEGLEVAEAEKETGCPGQAFISVSPGKVVDFYGKWLAQQRRCPFRLPPSQRKS